MMNEPPRTPVKNRLITPSIAGSADAAPLQQYWTERDIFHNKDVQISSASWQMSGKVKGVNRKGELMLQTERGTEVISAGEISVRSAR